MKTYLWTLGTATSIWINALIPGARPRETLCGHMHRSDWRLCRAVCRLFDGLDRDHCRASHLAGCPCCARLRGDLAALLANHDED